MELTKVKGIGEKTEQKLNELGIFNSLDLVTYLPTKYIKLEPVPISEIRDGYFYVITAKYVKKLKNVKNKKIELFAVSVMDDEGDILEIDWFNQDFVSKVLHLENEYLFYGKISKNKNKFVMVNPEFESSKSPKKLQGIRVEYKTKGLLSSNKLNGLIKEAFSKENINGVIPSSVLAGFGLNSYKDAVYSLHFPLSETELESNLRRIRLERVVNLILAYDKLKNENKTIRKMQYLLPSSVITSAVNLVGYDLSSSQVDAINLLIQKLQKPYNINYLLLGDVGSGKTIVAFLLCYYVIKNGGKAVFLAPSEALVNQHFASAKFLEKLGVRVEKLTASTVKSKRNEILEQLNNGRIDLLIGTHSLLSKDVNLSEFTFSVIDEQQKFGVRQKGELLNKLAEKDSVILSATPIPRAINLMFSSSLDVVEIFKPESRKTNIKTMLVGNNKLYDMLDYLYEKTKENEKSFVVCPTINGSDFNMGVYQIIDYYKKKFNYDVKVMNGRLSEADNLKNMQDFNKSGGIMVSTTIVEVGIDIQDAKNMAIVSADRFGLATLHQLRGRVGRDGRSANCFLHYSSNNELIMKRLNIIKENDDGFIISKLDYKLRGGGEIYGEKQSGKDASIDSELIDESLIIEGQKIYSAIKESGIALSPVDLGGENSIIDFNNDVVLA